MIDIDWKKDYHGEFVCPKCQTKGMRTHGKQDLSKKVRFYCYNCSHHCSQSSEIHIKPIPDPLNDSIIWYTNYRIKEFICPECQNKNMYFTEIDKYHKKIFLCKTCKKHVYDSISLKLVNYSRYSTDIPPIKPFVFQEDEWDLRALIINFDSPNISKANINFKSFHLDWFKQRVKGYIQYLCKSRQITSFESISHYVSALRSFSNYLIKENIEGFHQINRSLILGFYSYREKLTQILLGTLRDFFRLGNIQGWFTVDRDLIQDRDYPKIRRGNPDPITDVVREQIENNLHLLPEPIARMWIIAFFTAMRPNELALLKKDCLVQEGSHWKIVWQRKKVKDYHELPISRTIAQVIQEQQEYIEDLWGKDWEYLFCHYRGLSEDDLTHPKLTPVKKVIPSTHSPLQLAIRYLIKQLDIQDDNGELANFSPRLVRPTRLTQLFQQGHDLAVVSAWAKHKHLATTSTYYIQVNCDLIEKEVGHIQKALFNADGKRIEYETFPKSFWDNPTAHQLELQSTHINTPIYGYCGLPLDKRCDKFRACYTCRCFVAVTEKLPQYIKTRDELRAKESRALANGADVLVEQFRRQADQLDKIISSLQEQSAS